MSIHVRNKQCNKDFDILYGKNVTMKRQNFNDLT